MPNATMAISSVQNFFMPFSSTGLAAMSMACEPIGSIAIGMFEANSHPLCSKDREATEPKKAHVTSSWDRKKGHVRLPPGRVVASRCGGELR